MAPYLKSFGEPDETMQLDGGIEGDEGDCNVGGVGSNALIAGTQHGMPAVFAANG